MSLYKCLASLVVWYGLLLFFHFQEIGGKNPLYNDLMWLWALLMVGHTAFVLFIRIEAGKGTDAYPKASTVGVFVSDRNRFSLSRTQILFWTILFVSTYFAMAIHNAKVSEGEQPVDVEVPGEFLVLMGMSVATFTASGILNRGKDGELVRNLGRSASIQDLVTSEYERSKGTIEVSRVQMLLFTGIAWVTYTFTVGEFIFDRNLDASRSFDGFPSFSESLLILIGFSHSSYLLGKGEGEKKSRIKEDQPVAQDPDPTPPMN